LAKSPKFAKSRSDNPAAKFLKTLNVLGFLEKNGSFVLPKKTVLFMKKKFLKKTQKWLFAILKF